MEYDKIILESNLPVLKLDLKYPQEQIYAELSALKKKLYRKLAMMNGRDAH